MFIGSRISVADAINKKSFVEQYFSFVRLTWIFFIIDHTEAYTGNKYNTS